VLDPLRSVFLLDEQDARSGGDNVVLENLDATGDAQGEIESQPTFERLRFAGDPAVGPGHHQVFEEVRDGFVRCGKEFR